MQLDIHNVELIECSEIEERPGYIVRTIRFTTPTETLTITAFGPSELLTGIPYNIVRNPQFQPVKR